MDIIRQHREACWADQAKKAAKKQKAQQDQAVDTGGSGDDVGDDISVSAGSDYQTWWAACKQDVERLKALPDHDDRDALKIDLVEKYTPYVDGWLASDDQGQNDVIAYNVIWAADAGELGTAIVLADACIDRGVKFQMMKRDPQTFVADMVFRHEESVHKENPNISVSQEFTRVREYFEAGDWEINTVLQSRYYKLMGNSDLEDSKDEHTRFAIALKQSAYDNFVRANDLNGGRGGIGVQTLMEKLGKEIEAEKAEAKAEAEKAEPEDKTKDSKASDKSNAK